jgi:hypothetical protein
VKKLSAKQQVSVMALGGSFTAVPLTGPSLFCLQYLFEEVCEV